MAWACAAGGTDCIFYIKTTRTADKNGTEFCHSTKKSVAIPTQMPKLNVNNIASR
jgi:hypothetical protein